MKKPRMAFASSVAVESSANTFVDVSIAQTLEDSTRPVARPAARRQDPGAPVGGTREGGGRSAKFVPLCKALCA